MKRELDGSRSYEIDEDGIQFFYDNDVFYLKSSEIPQLIEDIQQNASQSPINGRT